MAETTTTVTVEGLTCGHCVAAVRDEVGQIPGVIDVAVELETGLVTITSTAPVAAEVLVAAVDEAGYEVVA